MDNSELLNTVFSAATDYAIIVMDDNGMIRAWNAGAEHMTGFAGNEVAGAHLGILFTEGDRANNIPQEELKTASVAMRCAGQHWYRRKDGSRFMGDSVITPSHDAVGAQTGFLMILRDITERKRADEELHSLARFDALTGLANRSSFRTRLAEMVASTLRSDHLLILQMIDLDHFKEVNDTLGHHSGDVLLRQAARRMRKVTRDTDFIARIGGDEFVVLQPNAHSPETGGRLAEKLLEALSKPFYIDGHEVFSGASIGVAICPQDAHEPELLLRRADLALYRVKKTGRGGFACFTEHLDAEAHKRSRDLAELRQVVEQRSFRLEYQPKINGRTGHVIGVEALLRVDNPALAAYPIDYVIGLAREAGLMPKIGAWVLMHGCTQMRKWQQAGFPQMRLCVNLCTRELTDPEIIRQVDAVLSDTGLPPHHLEIEVTEHQLFASKEQGLSTLEKLRARGSLIAIDDFGTGYSSLNYLRWLPIDSLKLDKTFVLSIPHDEQTCAIVKFIIGLAHSLNLEVIAEGVESPAQADFLRRQQCEQMQGFFFSRPLSAEAMTDWLAKAVPFAAG